MEEGHVSQLLILFLAAVTLWLLWPFLSALLFGVFTAYFLHELEIYLYERLDNRALSSASIIMLLFVFVSGMVYGITSSVDLISQNINIFLERVYQDASFFITVFNLPSEFANIARDIVTNISDGIRSGIIGELQRAPTVLVNFFVFLVTTIYFFKDGPHIRTKILDMFDELDDRRAKIARTVFRDLSDIFNGVFFYRTLMSFIVLFIASFGFLILEIEFWWGWAMLVAILQFLPIVNPFLAYLPLGVVTMTQGGFWTGLLIIVYGVVAITAFPELYLGSRLRSQRADEHPLILFLGFIAGVIVFGLKGIFLGPIILVMTKNFFIQFFEKI
jgi:predicted PurR-regulated permease PerM